MQGWEEIARLFPGKSARCCQAKFQQMQLQNNHEAYVAAPLLMPCFLHHADGCLPPSHREYEDADDEEMPGLSRGTSPIASPILPDHRHHHHHHHHHHHYRHRFPHGRQQECPLVLPADYRTPKQKEMDIGAWFRGLDLVLVVDDLQQQRDERQFYAFA